MAKVWLVGAGGMARDYIKILEHLKTDYLTIGRGEVSADLCKGISTKPVLTGGLNSFLSANPKKADYAIIAVPAEELASCAEMLIHYGIRNILTEKPAGISKNEVEKLYILSKEKSTNLLLAYNRRFYASTLAAKKMIAEDGGVTSCHFEFTEWSHVIEKLKKPEKVFQKWFLGNSTHVVDLAFYLAGKPKEFAAFTKSTLKWHRSASIFTGAGVTDRGALFSYHANWQGPGRWSVEILTNKHRYIFKPMEKLSVIKLGTVKEEMVNINDSLDLEYKPGLYVEITSFLNNDFSTHCNINDQMDMMDFYYKLANYTE